MYIQIQAKTNAKRIHIQNKICTNEHLNSLRANPTFQKPGTSKTGFGQVKIMKEVV